MPRFRATVLLASLLLAATACEAPENQPVDDHDGDSAATRAAATPSAGTAADEHASGRAASSGEHGAAGHGAGGDDGQPLLAIMQQLGAEMTALTQGLMIDDSATVARSAAAIAEHAPIAAADVARIHATLGTDMARFEAVDESVHVASLRLHQAARAGELELVVQRLGEVQRGCVSCHSQFRDLLRTSRTGG